MCIPTNIKITSWFWDKTQASIVYVVGKAYYSYIFGSEICGWADTFSTVSLISEGYSYTHLHDLAMRIIYLGGRSTETEPGWNIGATVLSFVTLSIYDAVLGSQLIRDDQFRRFRQPVLPHMTALVIINRWWKNKCGRPFKNGKMFNNSNSIRIGVIIRLLCQHTSFFSRMLVFLKGKVHVFVKLLGLAYDLRHVDCIILICVNKILTNTS